MNNSEKDRVCKNDAFYMWVQELQVSDNFQIYFNNEG